ncbi:MAG: replication initiator [Nocardioides sp.]
MSLHKVGTAMAHAAADAVGVCVRPLLREVTDRATGQVVRVPIPCGSTRASVCGACAEKARRLRMHQCREGWHLTEDPLLAVTLPDPDDGDCNEDSDQADQGRNFHTEDATSERRPGGRVRSTRRLDGFPTLRGSKPAPESVGRTFTDPRTGRVYQPSMFITLTLPSYGRVAEGSPVDPSRYDYRAAALDALLFPRLVDRWWQNLRRVAGYKVQYFAAVEPQRRLAPHLHAAIRGAIPRATIRQVTAATYRAIWWPAVDRIRYRTAEAMPAWDKTHGGLLDQTSGELLPTWDQALDQLDQADADPLHVLAFGSQVDIKGIIGGTEQTQKAVGYLCKYLTKNTAETYLPTDYAEADPRYLAHIARLHQEIEALPCSEECGNWVRYGITPRGAGPHLTPGQCTAKAHDPECLGLGGRRVLVSRHWTGKTLTDHRADRAAVVREVLQAAGYDPEDSRRMAADVLADDGQPRYTWADVPVQERDYVTVIAQSLHQRQTWQQQYDTAKRLAQQRPGAPPGTPVETHSATTDQEGQAA